MHTRMLVPAIVLMLAVGGCSEMPQLGGPTYGETAGSVGSQSDRNGKITALSIVKVDENYKFGIGTVVGAVAGGLLGSQIGGGTGSTVAAVVGAAAGAAGGTVAESKLKNKDAQSVTVRMNTGGEVTIVQPVDGRLQNGMKVRVEGSGETARVVPQ